MATVILEQDRADMKDVSAYPRFMIRQAAQGEAQHYWSKEKGWVNYVDGDVFLHTAVKHLELPEGGEWVKLEESKSVVIRSEHSLKEILPEDFQRNAVEALGGAGFLVETYWRPHGLAHGRVFFEGPVLLVRAFAGVAEGRTATIAEGLTARVGTLLPEETRSQVTLLPQPPVRDQAGGLWKFEVAVAAASRAILEGLDGVVTETNQSLELMTPMGKSNRLQRLFTAAGLHISQAIEAPADSRWGDLGQPQRIVTAVLQPSEDKPWSTTPLAKTELADFCRRITSAIGEVLETMDVSFSTHWLSDLGAWEITWHIGDPEITQYQKMESEDEDEETCAAVQERTSVVSITESGIAIRSVTEVDGCLVVQGDWKPGLTKEALIEAASLDPSVTNYELETGTVTTRLSTVQEQTSDDGGVKSQEQVDEALQHYYQPSDYSCGPTCIKMAADALEMGAQYSIDDLVDFCQSDPMTGTDDKRMAQGMTKIGLPFTVGTSKDIDGLVEALGRGSLIILRTLTKGIKHWIVLHSFEGGKFQVHDPWLGEITYTPKKVMAIWAPRDFFYFEVPSRAPSRQVDSYQIATCAFLKSLSEDMANPEIVYVRVADSPEVIAGLDKALQEAFPGQVDWVVEYVHSMMDPGLSLVALRAHEVIGFYALGRRGVLAGVEAEGMECLEDLTPYKDKAALEGIALGVVPSARGLGIGSKLKDYPKELGADYVWGLQLEELNNLQHWLKRRRLVAKLPGMYATLQDLTSSA